MTKYTIVVDDKDLADMTVGRFMREGCGAVERISADGATSYICEDSRVAINMAIEPHRNWLVPVLEHEQVQDAAIITGDLARAIGSEYAIPWYDKSGEA